MPKHETFNQIFERACKRKGGELDALRQAASCEFVNVVVEKSQKGT